MFLMILPVFAVFMVTVILTGVVLMWLRHKAILDMPNERSSHAIPTPRGGGIAVSFVVLVAWISCYLRDGEFPFLLVILSAGGLALLSWLDDLLNLSAKIRLLAQLFAVGLSLSWIYASGSPFQNLIPFWIEAVILLLLWAGFVNFFNFMDGIDGISGLEAMAIGGGFALVGYFVPDLSLRPFIGLAIAAAAFGFLLWNWHPAKLFLGDVGSVPLGLLLGGLMLKLAAVGLWAPAIILPLYYLSDAGLTLVKRALRREKVWQAHREHFYQQAVISGYSHAQVASAIGLCNLGLVGLAVWAIWQPFFALGASLVAVGLLLAWMARGQKA